MPPASRSISTSDNRFPLALIDSQDVSFSDPFREYLASYGCEVLVNRLVSGTPDYHLIFGNWSFVKKILDHPRDKLTKTLLVIWDDWPAEENKQGERVKTALVDRPLSENQTGEILSFFFTSRMAVKDLRKERHAKPKKQEVSLPSPREQATDEERRIAQTISQVFGANHQRRRRRVFPVLGLMIVTFPIWWYLLTLSWGVLSLFFAGKFLLSGSSHTTVRFVSMSETAIGQSEKILSLGADFLKVVGKEELLHEQESLVSLLKSAADAVGEAAEIFSLGQKTAQRIFRIDDNNQPSLASSLTQLRTRVAAVETSLAIAQANLEHLVSQREFPLSLNVVQTWGLRGGRQLEKLRRMIGLSHQLLTVYLHLSGFTSKQTYLILLQNSMELRPTGGFIGSLATLNFESGRLTELQIQDVYALDGQLRGHVAPPAAIRDYLGQEHWYLRDSNWDPDFSISGPLAAWFYQKEGGARVDGTIALNLPLVVNLLRVLGPVTLVDFNDRITADNFFAKTLLYTQTNFFPGSTQKKDFLGSLATTILRSLTENKTVSPGKLLSVVTEGLVSHNILFSFNDAKLQALVENYDWAGTISAPHKSCRQEQQKIPCYGDFLYPVEANLGVNKANFFVKREILNQITVAGDGSVTHTLTTKFRNESTNEIKDGGGPYKAYLRFFLPPDIVIDNFLVDGTTAAWDWLPTEELGVVGLLLEVPPQNEKTLSFSWRRKKQLTVTGEGAIYEFWWQKQPGLVNTAGTTILAYPGGWSAAAIPPPQMPENLLSVANGDEFRYNLTLSRDEAVRVLFSKGLP